MSKAAPYPILTFADKTEWSDWLAKYHAIERGVWVRLAKRGASFVSVSRSDALDVALCYGWIDGQAKSLGTEAWLQKFTPRGKRSLWSKKNRENVERLVASGAMQEAGLRAVAAAKADGRWERAYDSPATAAIPPDLRAALDQHPEARAFFETLTARSRYAVLNRIQTAVRPETRARRIDGFIQMLTRKETPYF